MVEKITLAQQHAVNEQRRLGRTDRQAEKIIGLSHGILSRPFIVEGGTLLPRPNRFTLF